MSLAFTFPENENEIIYADGFGTFDISLCQVNECFQFKPTDAIIYKLLNDPCCCCMCCGFCSCTTYYVDGDKFGIGTSYDVSGNIISKKNVKEDIPFSNIIVEKGYYGPSPIPIEKDVVYHQSHLLFNNYLGAHLLRESGLPSRLDVSMNINLRNSLNSSYLEFGTKDLPYTNNEKNQLNISRFMLETISKFDPSRLQNFNDCSLFGINAKDIDVYNIDNNFHTYLNIPLKIGDTIVFKIYYEMQSGLAEFVNSTPVALGWKDQLVFNADLVNQQIFDSIDRNNDGCLDYNEWALWQSKQKTKLGTRSYLIQLRITDY